MDVSCHSQDLDQDRDGTDRGKKKALFDVQDYLQGILWNLQMYIDGYVPNFYWRYSPRYSPSVADIADWLRSQDPEALAKISIPTTLAPPLPAAIACLCMLPMTKSGRAFLPERLQHLVEPGSPLLEALKWRGVSSGLNIPEILRVVQEQAPEELLDFNDSSRSR